MLVCEKIWIFILKHRKGSSRWTCFANYMNETIRFKAVSIEIATCSLIMISNALIVVTQSDFIFVVSRLLSCLTPILCGRVTHTKVTSKERSGSSVRTNTRSFRLTEASRREAVLLKMFFHPARRNRTTMTTVSLSHSKSENLDSYHLSAFESF